MISGHAPQITCRFSYRQFIWLNVVAFCITSCTTTHYRSRGQLPILVGVKEEHSAIFSHEGQNSFFLWGLLPQNHVVWIDEEVSQMGFVSGANISVEEYQTGLNLLKTILTLGMYIPKNYRITAYGLKAQND